MDTFFRGLIAGFTAGIVKDIPDFFLHSVFHFKKLSFWDYAGVVTFNKMPHSFIEHVVAFGFQLIFSTGLGIVFIFLASKVVKTKHYLLEGLVFGSSVWFIITAAIKVFRITELQTKGLSDPLITLLLSMAYGLLLMVIDHWLQNRALGKEV